MDSAPVPLSVQCRNAKHFLRNAAMAKKSQLFNDELRHLHQYETLVSATIPDHPHFEEMKTEKQIVELQIPLANVRKRIQELESDTSRSHVLGNFKSSSSSSKSEKSTPRSKSSTKSPRLTESSMPSGHIAYSAKPSKKTSRALPIPTTLKRPEPLQQQQKLQSWGVWTANPQDSPVSPPSKKHSSSTHKSRKIGGDLKSPTSSSARDAPFLLPPRSRSPG